MNDKISFISFLLAFLMLFTAVGVNVYADNPGYTKKDVTAYVFSLEETETLGCLLLDDLPGEPYIDAVDFLKHAFTVDFTVSEKDGAVIVSRPDSKMVVDPVNETVFFDDFDVFTSSNANYDGTDLEADFVEIIDIQPSSDEKSAFFELAKYGFDLIADDGRIYFPLSLISDFCAYSYNGAMYVDGNIYFVHSFEIDYFDRSSVICAEKRDEATAKFTYDLLCFVFDELYGCPLNAKITQSIVEKGFDRSLEEYDEVTKEARSLLLSTDPWDYFTALFYLFPYFDDGGHTVLQYEVFDCYGHPGSLVYEAYAPIFRGDAPENERNDRLKESLQKLDEMYSKPVPVKEARDAVYSEEEIVKSWEGVAKLYVHGDTAIFLFDVFENEILEPLKWSLDYAAENGIDNFVFDIASNTGGSSAVLEYIMTIVEAADTHSNVSEFMTLDTVTGVSYLTKSYVDLDLDGVFDEKDAGVAYDLNFAFLTSEASFSCGNALPMIAKGLGYPVIGQKSGGGACMIVQVFLPEGHYLFSSWNIKMVDRNEVDFDLGAAVDYDLTRLNDDGSVDYSGLFDIDRVSELIAEFYAPKAGDVNGDGVINALDVTAIMKYLVGSEEADFIASLADFDANGRVNARDVIAMMKAAVGR